MTLASAGEMMTRPSEAFTGMPLLLAVQLAPPSVLLRTFPGKATPNRTAGEPGLTLGADFSSLPRAHHVRPPPLLFGLWVYRVESLFGSTVRSSGAPPAGSGTARSVHVAPPSWLLATPLSNCAKVVA